jgi:hypothetical protein
LDKDSIVAGLWAVRMEICSAPWAIGGIIGLIASGITGIGGLSKSEPSQLISGKDVGFNFNLKDNDTGNNILHVTYLVTLMSE